MINLNLLNKALTDANIKDSEFRLLYLIANNISMSKTDEKEIYNGFLMDKLNLGERQIQRLTKSLADKGYISKRVIGSKRNKNGNIYSLVVDVITSDTSSDTTSVKNDTPYNNTKERELLVNSSTTEENSNTNLRKCEEIDDVPFGVDEAATDSSIQETSVSERIEDKEVNSRNMGYTYTEEELRAANSQPIEEWRQIEETRIGKHQTVNVWVGKILKRGYDLLRSFEKSKTGEGASAYSIEICELIGKMNKAVEANTLTDGQYKAFEKFCNSYHRAADNKEAYFARGVQMKGKQPQTESTIMEAAPTTENINHTPPTPISESDSSNEIMTAEILMTAFENFGEGKGASQYSYYSFNETTLKTEEMNDEERDYFRAEEGRFTDEGVLNRYIKAHKWLRNPKDADRLFYAYQERASEIANGDYTLFEKYINLWNKYCEQVV